MEHRWGERVAVSLSVELSWGSAPPVAGSLENVSASGAFVRTHGRGPPRGPVEVAFPQLGLPRGRAVRLQAFVVRETAAGVGIEWRELAPRPVREIIFRGRRSQSVRSSARPRPSIRHFPDRRNTAMQPREQPDAEHGPAGVGDGGQVVAARCEIHLRSFS
jgi:hypothetical protein